MASEIVIHLDFTLKRYRHFIESINNQYSLTETFFVLNAYSYKGNPEKKSRFKRVYDILFSIAEYDHRLSYDNRRMKDLILSHSGLQQILDQEDVPQSLVPALNALDGKCLFLLKKLLIYDKSGVDFMIDFEHHHLDVDDINQEWITRLENCFEFYRKDNTYGDSFGNTLDTDSYKRKLRVSLYPLLMKYYKDSPYVTIDQIDNIINEFNVQFDRLQETFKFRPYDVYSLNTLKSYMYNSRLTFKLKDPTYSFKQLEKDISEIQEIQHEMRIVDYYPFMRASEFIGDRLESRDNNDLDEDRKMIKTMDEYLKHFSTAFSICSQQSFYPLQSLYNDCLVTKEDFGTVFFASSYCRPVQYSHIQERLEALQTKYLLCKNALYLKEERLEIESIKKGIDQSKKQTIEIISAFTAIITFIFGTIDFFSDAKASSFENQVFNILSLGLILLLFVSGISVFTMRHEDSFKHYLNKPRFWMCTISFVCFLGLLVFLVVRISPLLLVSD